MNPSLGVQARLRSWGTLVRRGARAWMGLGLLVVSALEYVKAMPGSDTSAVMQSDHGILGSANPSHPPPPPSNADFRLPCLTSSFLAILGLTLAQV